MELKEDSVLYSANAERKAEPEIYNDYLSIDISHEKTYPIEMLKNLNKLNQISKFEENWDGNGAQPFSINLISMLKDIIRKLKWQPEIAPTAAGGL